MKYLELFGMPGTGKTYIIRYLKNYNLDLKIKNKFFAFEKRSKTSFFIKIFYIFIGSFIFSNAPYLKKIIIFFKNFYKPKKSNIISIRTLSILFNTIFLVSIISINALRKNKKNIFIDQGFFQILFSIVYEMDIKNKYIFKSVITNWLLIPLSFKNKIYLTYVESESKLILERLLVRNGDSILDRKKDLKNLKIYQSIFEQIFDFLVKENENYPNIFLNKINSNEQIMDLLKL
tara:strand:+ start:1600 stop:2298 length:699 start_codon:yes stop_codon:yes gene_type:complete